MGETVQDIVQGKASFVSGEIQWAGMKCVLHTHSMGDRLTYTKEDFFTFKSPVQSKILAHINRDLKALLACVCSEALNLKK